MGVYKNEIKYAIYTDIQCVHGDIQKNHRKKNDWYKDDIQGKKWTQSP